MIHINGSDVPSTLGTVKGYPSKIRLCLEILNHSRAPGAALLSFTQGGRVIHNTNIPVNPMSGTLANGIEIDMSKVSYEANVPVNIEWCVSHRGIILAYHPEEKDLIIQSY